MKAFRASWLLALLAALAVAAEAQAPEPGAALPPAEAPEAEAPEPEAPEPADASDEVFIPSEEIQADEEVTFPVDI